MKCDVGTTPGDLNGRSLPESRQLGIGELGSPAKLDFAMEMRVSRQSLERGAIRAWGEWLDELALWERYYEEVQIILGATTPGATGYFHQIYFKQNKRVAPTSAVKTLNSSSNFTIDSFTAFVPTCVLSCTIPASGAYSANALISFNAEM